MAGPTADLVLERMKVLDVDQRDRARADA